MSIVDGSKTEVLVKDTVASELRAAVISGALRPGERIVEALWAAKLGVAQASIREAVNILTQEGFVTKLSGRSARIVFLSDKDVFQLYELRSAIEGLAARLTAQRQADISEIQLALDGMRDSVISADVERLMNFDLRFHLKLCEAAGNGFLLEHARRILLPFFAFVRMRVMSSPQGGMSWAKDIEVHQRIIDLIREGEGEVVEHYLKSAMARFAQTARSNWDDRSADSG